MAGENLATLFMLVCWLVWKEHNARVFNQRSCTSGQLFGGIKDEISIWKEAGLLKDCNELGLVFLLVFGLVQDPTPPLSTAYCRCYL
uniref:Uncharacterized protein n=1 Tax=Oryza meridionalis TaxID=40149 RepID=A0A0E0DI64_9ORYZ